MTRRVRVQSRKWPDRPHWEFDATLLGSDAAGSWLGVRRGAWISRPGAGFGAHCDQVVLVPHQRWWVATFYGDHPDRPVNVYVDISTPSTWQEHVVRAVDLDLDVVQGTSGRVWVDDEDEFADHRVRYAYPEEVVDRALASCADVQAALSAGRTPFDGSAAPWLAQLG